jgi:hypothetical protein
MRVRPTRIGPVRSSIRARQRRSASVSTSRKRGGWDLASYEGGPEPRVAEEVIFVRGVSL